MLKHSKQRIHIISFEAFIKGSASKSIYELNINFGSEKRIVPDCLNHNHLSEGQRSQLQFYLTFASVTANYQTSLFYMFQEVMRATREFKCCAGCCWCASADCCAFEMMVEAPVGTTVGYIRQASVRKVRLNAQGLPEAF